MAIVTTTTAMTYLVGRCWLGSILVASTDEGVAAIFLGDDRAALVRSLRSRFPDVQLVGGDQRLDDLVAEVVRFVEAPASRFEPPLELRGTDFERRVWLALREIPAGSTATYSEIATHIGAPHASYDVGQACASNPLAVVVPCHRVVRKDGTLGGYRWGTRRKQALLAREAASPRAS
jgi:AraC family transcriptional regulator, regulatory protein of adaptative response / methylated-DNA-[protein]-cysteine methyltransferase